RVGRGVGVFVVVAVAVGVFVTVPVGVTVGVGTSAATLNVALALALPACGSRTRPDAGVPGGATDTVCAVSVNDPGTMFPQTTFGAAMPRAPRSSVRVRLLAGAPVAIESDCQSMNAPVICVPSLS